MFSKLSEKTLIEILSHSKNATVIYISEQMHIGFINNAMLALWRKTPAVIGEKLSDVSPNFDSFANELSSVWKTGTPHVTKDVLAHVKINGKTEIVYFDFEFLPVLDSKGQTSSLITTATNVTERLNAFNFAKEKELEAALLNRKLTLINSQLEGVNVDLNALNQEHILTIKESNSSGMESIALNKNLNVNNKNLQLANSELEYLNVKLLLAVEAAGVGTWHIEPADKSLTYNQNLADIFGFEGEAPMTYEDAMGQVAEEHRLLIEEATEKAIKNGGDYAFTYQQKRFNDGQIIWLRSLGKIISDENGAYNIFSGIVIDVTQELNSLKVLKESEERFRSLAEGSEILISINDIDGKVEYINKAWAVLLGEDAVELVNHGWLVFLHPEDKEKTLFKFDEGIKATKPFTAEFRIVDANNELHWVYSTVNPRFSPDGNLIGTISSSIDMTEMLSQREQLLEANKSLNIALDAGGFGSTEADLTTGQMIVNAQFKKCYGLSVNEEITYQQQFDFVLPQYADEIKKRVDKALKNRSSYQSQHEIQWPDGSIHWISVHGRAIYNEEGEPIKLVGIVSDISEEKNDAQRKNDFIGIVSHELKTPLTSVNGYLQILASKAKKTEDVFAINAFDKTLVQVKKMTTMINGFLNVSRLEAGKIHLDKQVFNFVDLVNDVKDEIETTNTTHEILFEPFEQIMVSADKDKIWQVINNFISNAVKYSPLKSEILISCKLVNDNINVCVKDYGMGIKAEDINHVFERYYRVSGKQMTNISGFGVGLYLCSEIVKMHQGKVWVESEFEKGSTFCFSLPIFL